jgi:hypothetical protein
VRAFVRAYPAIYVFAMVAVKTQKLKSERKIIVYQPCVKSRATADLSSMCGSVIVDMVDRQKLGF